MHRGSRALCAIVTPLALGMGLLGLTSCDDGGARVDPAAAPLAIPHAMVLSPADLGAEKTACTVTVPPDRLLVITTLVFRNRSLDRTLSSEELRFEQGPQPVQQTVAALVFTPHGPLRPDAATWLLCLPGSPGLEVHDSPDLSLEAMPGIESVSASALAHDTAVLLAIDPEGEVSLPPTAAQIHTAHISALVLVRIEAPAATDPRLAALFQAGQLIPHGHLAVRLPLPGADQHYLDLVKALSAPAAPTARR